MSPISYLPWAPDTHIEMQGGASYNNYRKYGNEASS